MDSVVLSVISLSYQQNYHSTGTPIA